VSVARPSAVGKRSAKRKGVPGCDASGTGYCSPAKSSRGNVTPAHEGITRAISSITASASRNGAGRPTRSESSTSTSRSARACPGGSHAFRTRWMRRSVFTKVPSFSANDEPGNTTSAKRAVPVRKSSCTARNSRPWNQRSACARSGSERTGFSPMTYIPFTGEPSVTISVIFRPGFSESASSATPHAAAKLRRAAGSATDW
jgi:hypothetical protein